MSSLYLVATPIGNLEDISQRAVRILQQVSAIACEDTRVSRHLLNSLGIEKPLFSLHQHNEYEATRQLLARVEAGEDIAVISDAGTPVISDPGALIARLAHERGVKVVPIPGANAVVSALSASGLTGDQFFFAGFVPAKAGEKKRFLSALESISCTAVCYETPHRIADTLAMMRAIYEPTRDLVIARELTKKFEQIVKLTVGESVTWLESDVNHCRGEFVILLGSAQILVNVEKWQALAEDLATNGIPSKAVAALIHKHYGANKKEVYNHLIGK